MVVLILSVMPITRQMVNVEQPQDRKVQTTEKIQEENKNLKAAQAVNEHQVSRGHLNRNEVYLLAMVINGEAYDEPYLGKVAVGAVILNRMQSKQFPNTLYGVISQDNAFESVTNNQYQRPLTADSIKAAEDAIKGWDPTNGALYFWNPATAQSKWVWSRPITGQIGRHVFAK